MCTAVFVRGGRESAAVDTEGSDEESSDEESESKSDVENERCETWLSAHYMPDLFDCSTVMGATRVQCECGMIAQVFGTYI